MKIYIKILLTILISSTYSFITLSSYGQNTKIGGGVNHTVMLCDNRNVYVWGDNTAGEAGNGAIGGNFPTAGQHVIGLGGIGFLNNIKAVDAGSGSHNLALSCNGDSSISWGSNIAGQLGIGATGIDNATPQRVHGINNVGFLTGVKLLAGSTSSSYAIFNDGRVAAWGDNQYGQLGDGSVANRNYPMYVLKDAAFGGGQLTNIVDFQAGDAFVVALDANGEVWFWGNDARGVGGQGTVCAADGCNNITLAKKVRNSLNNGFLNGIVKIAAGDRHVMALTATDSLLSWGSDWARQLGRGNAGNSGLPAAVWDVNDAVGVNILRGVVAIAGGNGHSVAVLANGRVVTFGQQDEGQLGNGVFSTSKVNYPIYVLEPAGVNPIENIYNLGEGDNNSFLINTSGQLFTFGMNNLGQLGIGNTTNQSLPVLLTSPCVVTFPPRQPVAKLGPDQLLCTATSVLLNAGDGGSGYLYDWYRNNTLVVGNGGRTYSVNQPGTYKVTIKVPSPNCGVVDTLYSTDEIVVSYKNITPVGETVCNATANLSVIGTGKYKWWTASTGGTVVAKGPSYTTPVITATTTYYVEDTSSFKSHIGPLNPASGTNGRRQYATNLMKLRFTANSPFMIDSVTIGAYNLWDGSFSVTVELRDFGTDALVGSATTPVMSGALNPTWHKVLLGLNVPAAGDYYLRYATSTPANARIAESASAAYPVGSYPFNDVNGFASITQYFRASDGTLNTGMYGMFWDWVISSGNTCSRTPVVATYNCPLPVELINFVGEVYGNEVNLSWATRFETKNAAFIIERSIDGIHFDAIGSIEGKGTINELSNYSFTDSNPFSVKSYYRLKQIDINNAYQYSSIIALNLTKNQSTYVYPNPSNDLFTLVCYETGELTFEIMNVEGKVVQNVKLTNDSIMKYSFGDSLAKGYYIIRIISKQNVETYSIIKN